MCINFKSKSLNNIGILKIKSIQNGYIDYNKIIIDRSPITSKNVFGKYMTKHNYIDKNEIKLYYYFQIL